MAREYFQLQLIGVTNVSDTLYIIHLSNDKFSFIPGQHVSLSLSNGSVSREYSIASGLNDATLDILIYEVPEGNLSKKIRSLSIGSYLYVGSPVGYFQLPDNFQRHRVVLIATGSGIAPFRSFYRSYATFPFQIIHGVKDLQDNFRCDIGTGSSYTLCLSKNADGDFKGRVTDFIQTQYFEKDTLFFLCGNGEMIHDVFMFLKNCGVDRNLIMYEEYYNN